jgi:alkaline phosphatase
MLAPKVALSVALITDTHYADADASGSRYFRESLAKMTEAREQLGKRRPAMAVSLGDLIDFAKPTTSPEAETAFLKRINAVFSQIARERHYVLGNHCVGTLTKAEFLAAVGKKQPYYSFDKKGWHFVVLDACCRPDGVDYGRGNFKWNESEIPDTQRAWLAADLKKAKGKTIVFVHQRLDSPTRTDYKVKSAEAVRRILEESGKVALVFMGHSHQNEYQEINGIGYVTLAAMIEGTGATNNGYALLHLHTDGTHRLEGFRKHAEHPLAKRGATG